MSYPEAPLPLSALRHVRTQQTYFAAVLQCLLAAKPLHNFFISAESAQQLNLTNPLGSGGAVFEAYKKLSEAVAHDESEVAIVTAVDNLGHAVSATAPQFDLRHSADACEFLSFLLDMLHEDMNRVLKKGFGSAESTSGISNEELATRAMQAYLLRNDSHVTDNVLGMFKSSVTCNACNRRSDRMELCFAFSLPVPQGSNVTTLAKCFDDFAEVEELSGDNAYYCSACKGFVNATRQLVPYSYSNVLFIFLKRGGAITGKKSAKVEFPLSDYTPPGASTKYDLAAVCNHIGTATNGANSSFVKLGDGWHNFNWKSVTPMTAEEVVTPDAYVLMYLKKN